MNRYEDFIREFAEKFMENSIIEPEEFPELPLYADQVSDFLTSKLAIYEKDPLLTRSAISALVKNGLLSAPDKKKYSREQMIFIEFILCLKMAYRQSDIEAMLKPLVENAESKFDEQFDFYDLYKKLVPIYKAQRKEACDNTIRAIDTIKGAIRDSGADDDDALEIFLVLMSIAAQVDATMFLGKKLLREYFKPEKDEKPEKPMTKETRKKTVDKELRKKNYKKLAQLSEQ
jgi:hypothetical protein